MALLGRSPQTGKGGGASTSSRSTRARSLVPRCKPQQNNRGPPKTPERQPEKGGKGEEKGGGGPREPPRKGKNQQGRGVQAHLGSAQAAPFFLAWCRSRPELCPGGDVSALGSCPPPECAAPPFRMAAMLDDHTAPFAMSSMRLSAAASGFRRINSQMASETWPVWVVRLNLNRGTFWSTTETSRSGAEGSTRR